MLVAFFAENMLGQTRVTDEPHLLPVEKTKIHRFADVAVSFGPGFADLENFDCGKLETSAIENRGDSFKQLAAFFEWRAAPRFKRAPRRFRCALRFGNSGLGDEPNDLIRRARIDGSCDSAIYQITRIAQQLGS